MYEYNARLTHISLIIDLIVILINTSENRAFVVYMTAHRYHKSSIMYPGTKWCGSGDIAENYDDLGEDRELDLCCREHDSCPDFIQSGDTKHDITNTAMYTRLNCACDRKFRECLHKNVARSNSSSSAMVGRIYFDRLHTKCFMLEHPIIGCKMENQSTRCDEYLVDSSAPPIWQWFDVPHF